MSILERLFNRRPDPTTGWGALALPIPDFNVSNLRFGSLGFGDSIESARFLGKPDAVSWPGKESCKLLYARGGFELTFETGRLDYLAFFISQDEFQPKHRALAYAEPRLVGCSAPGARLSPQTGQDVIERIFGAPAHVETAYGETVLSYSIREHTLEFELDESSGRLKRWNIFPD